MEINIHLLINLIIKSKKRILKITGIFILIGLFIAFFSSHEYKTKSSLLMTENNSLFGAGSIVQQFGSLGGLNLGDQNENLIKPDVYPSIINSRKFLLDLSKTSCYVKDIDSVITVYDYFLKYKKPSFAEIISGYTIGLPKKIQKLIIQKEKNIKFKDSTNINVFYLSEDEDRLCNELYRRITFLYDAQTNIIEISVLMPERLMAVQFNDNVIDLLKEYIIKFKIQRANEDLEFISQQYKESEKEYLSAQAALASYRDQNFNITSSRAKNQEENLITAFNLAQNLYTSMAQQYMKAKVRVQESTPVFKTIDPAEYPLKRAKPQRSLILISYTILGLIFSLIIIISHYLYSQLKIKINNIKL